MKIFYTLLFAILFCTAHQLSAQGLTPSPVRQVFALEKGDSMEYHVWSTHKICGIVCNIYKTRVVDSVYYNAARDTMFITFTSTDTHFDSIQPGQYCVSSCRNEFDGGIFAQGENMLAIAIPDSNMSTAIDSHYSGTLLITNTDSSYSDPTQYNGTKQTYSYKVGGSYSTYTENYADSLGIVYKTIDDEQAVDNTEQLIYYHKANGKTWGQRFQDVGINDVAKGADIKVYPNPATDILIVQSDSYTHSRLDIYDLLSQKIRSTPLTSVETSVNISTLPTGIYTWKVSDGTNTIKTGKLVKQ